MHFSLSTSPKHKKEYSSDSSEKKYNLLHFRRISVLIELILAGKAKLSMASCSLYGGWAEFCHSVVARIANCVRLSNSEVN